MLTWLRGKTGSLLVKILLGLLVISFAVWGISGQIFTGVGNSVVNVGDTRISATEYRLAYDRQIQLLSQQFGTRLSREQARAFGLEQQVLSQLVAGAVLDEQAREMRLGVSEDRIAALIGQDVAFRNAAGQFDRNQFDFVMRQVGMQPRDYRRTREQLAVRQQIVDAVADGMSVPDTFLNAVALFEGEDRTAQYIVLQRSLVEPVADPSEEALSAWFAENAETYRAPEYRALQYARLEPQDIADPNAISDEQVAAFYDTHRDSFGEAEQRRISQLVFPNREAADAALVRLRAGETDLAGVAAELGRTASDIDLGLLSQEDIPDPAIAEAAFALEQGQPSDVVAGAFGPVILQVEEITGGQARPLDEVAEDIRQELALDEASRILLDVYDAYEDARAGGASLQEAAAEQNLQVVTIEAVDAVGLDPQGNPVEGIPEQETVLQQAFAAEPELENDPIQLAGNGYLFYEVTDITAARDRTLDEVRDQVVADWRDQQARQALADRAAEVAARLEGDGDVEAVATELGLEARTRRGLRRNGDDVDLGRQGVAAAFGVGPQGVETIAASEGDRQIVLKVTEVFAPANAGADTIAANTADAYSNSFADDVLDQLITRLQSQYSVTVNQGAIQQALSF